MAKQSNTGIYQLPNGNWAYRFTQTVNGKRHNHKSVKDENGEPMRSQKAAIRARQLAIMAAEASRNEKPRRRVTVAEVYQEYGIRLKVIDLPTTMMELPAGQEWVFEMVNNILIEVLGTIAEQERETIRKRQAEGIESAKAKGKKLGRPALTFPANWNEVYSVWKAGEITAKVAMVRTNTKRTSFYKLVNMTENQ